MRRCCELHSSTQPACMRIMLTTTLSRALARSQYIMASVDPNRQKRLDAKKQSEEKLGKLGKETVKLNLNEYEGGYGVPAR